MSLKTVLAGAFAVGLLGLCGGLGYAVYAAATAPEDARAGAADPAASAQGAGGNDPLEVDRGEEENWEATPSVLRNLRGARDLEAYRDAVERPVFNETRRPAAPPPAIPVAAAPAPAPAAFPDIRLHGVIREHSSSRGGGSAYVKTPSEPRGVWLSVGEEIEGWTLIGVGDSKVLFRRDGRQESVEMAPKFE